MCDFGEFFKICYLNISNYAEVVNVANFCLFCWKK